MIWRVFQGGLAGMVLGLALALCAAPAPAADKIPVGSHSALATPAQLEAEKTAMRLLDDPSIKDAQAKLRTELQSYPLYAMANAPQLLDAALKQWTLALLMREQAGDLAYQRILWEFDDTPHTWFGTTFGGASGIGDNPDNVYRTAFIDGEGRYEIVGKLSAKRPTQFTFETVRTKPGMQLEKPATPGAVDVGIQVAMITDRTLKIAPDGTFRITIGGDPAAAGPNHLATIPGVLEVAMRDVLGNWDQHPNHVELRRLDQPGVAPAPLDEDELIRRTAADLSNFVRFWLDAGLRWTGKAADNVILGPLPRDGGWGFIANGRYNIVPGEAIIVTLNPHGAAYLGFQAVDPWSVAPDGRKHLGSLNTSQVVPNKDGTITYVVSPEDPGVANWIDTGGVRQGFVLLRWQATPPGTKAEELVRRFELVKLEALKREKLGPHISAAQRRAQIAAHAKGYANRLRD